MNNFNTKFSLNNINAHKFKMRLTIPIKQSRTSVRADHIQQGRHPRTGVELSEIKDTVNGFSQAFIPLHKSITSLRKSNQSEEASRTSSIVKPKPRQAKIERYSISDQLINLIENVEKKEKAKSYDMNKINVRNIESKLAQ